VKRFLAWLLITAALFLGISVPSHLFLKAHPRRIAVAVDTSFEMQGARAGVRRELARLEGTRYAEFCLLTDKVKVHGWQETLNAAGDLVFYGPRDLSALADAARYPELAEADTVIVLTGARDTSALRGLRALRVISPR